MNEKASISGGTMESPYSGIHESHRDSRFVLLLSVAFVIELMTFFALAFPRLNSLATYGFGDPGANLVADSFLAQGKRPTIDFGYIYGLLPLVVGRVWFGALGRTPHAEIAFTVLSHVFLAWGLARLAYHLRFGSAGILLVVAAIPVGINQIYLSLVHAMEAPLLVHAMAFQAAGRRSAALATAVVAAFCKPSFSIVYSGVLVIFIVLEWTTEHPRQGRRLIAMLIPGALVAVVLALGLGWFYGSIPLLRTEIPITAAKMYSSLDGGFFFGIGRYFWHPAGARIGYYLGTYVLFWLTTTMLIVVASARIITNMIRHRAILSNGQQVLISIAVMQLIVIFVLFGHAGTAAYYFFILIVGIAFLVRDYSLKSWRLTALIIMAILGWRQIGDSIRAWRTDRPHEETAGLWVSPEILTEWREVRERASQPGTMLANRWGGARLFFPEANTFETWFLDPTIATPLEKTAALKQISEANVLYFPILWADHQTLCTAPGFVEALSRFKPTGKGKYFIEFKADDPAPVSSAP